MLHCTCSTRCEHAVTDCAVCADDYSTSIGYRCTKCNSTTSSASYAVLALLVAVVTAVLTCITYEMLDIGTITDAAAAITQHKSVLSKLKQLPWSKLRAPVVVFQILTQFISITGLQMPNLYKNFLSWLDAINFNIGWTFSIGYETHFLLYILMYVCSYYVDTHVRSPTTCHKHHSLRSCMQPL
jgi:hypothetical protein